MDKKNMKTIILILGIITLFLTGCSSTKVIHVDAEEFLQHAEVIKGMHSAASATYIGSTHDRAYIEFENYITFIRKAPVTYIYWTEIDSLPKDVAEKIKTGQPPWSPFDHKKYEALKHQNINLDKTEDLFAEPTQIDLSKP